MLLLVMAILMPYVGAWAQETTTGNGSKLILKDATSPTIKLKSNETTVAQLSFTITETAIAQDGTHLETYYGSPAKACGNRNTIKLQVVRFNKQKAY